MQQCISLTCLPIEKTLVYDPLVSRVIRELQVGNSEDACLGALLMHYGIEFRYNWISSLETPNPRIQCIISKNQNETL